MTRRAPPVRSRKPPRPGQSQETWRLTWLIGAITLVVLVVGGGLLVLRGWEAAPMFTPTSTAVTVRTTAASVQPTADETSVSASQVNTAMLDIPSLQQTMLALINRDRRDNKLDEVVWDSTAAAAGLMHAQEMAAFQYLSHWNLDGYGPDLRYARAGGRSNVYENVYMYQHGPIRATAKDWHTLIQEAQQALMGSPAHRANILDPHHTHVGIGIAYDSANGWLAISQEFTDQYINLDAAPLEAHIGEVITIKGRIAPATSNPSLNLAYEPMPKPLSVSDLKATGSFSSKAQIYASSSITTSTDGYFEQQVELNNNNPGLYHIKIWLDTDKGRVLATNIAVNVRTP